MTPLQTVLIGIFDVLAIMVLIMAGVLLKSKAKKEDSHGANQELLHGNNDLTQVVTNL